MLIFLEAGGADDSLVGVTPPLVFGGVLVPSPSGSGALARWLRLAGIGCWLADCAQLC